MFSAILNFINEKVGWLYIIAFNVFIGAALYFALGRYGKIRLGGPRALPEFSTGAWYAMLISAGLGIGLMFWGRGRADLPPDGAASAVRSRTLVDGAQPGLRWRPPTSTGGFMDGRCTAW